MTTISTTTAAAEAGVTVATIRDWARRCIIAATKVAGRWVIDTTSLARRIAIGAMRARKVQPMTATGTITLMRNGSYGIRGNADVLAAAYEAGSPVAPTNGPYAADRLYLGSTRETYGDYGRTLETLSLAYTKDDGQAVYYIDTTRLAEAPAFAAALQEQQDREDAAEMANRRRDDGYLNPRYM